MPYQISKLFEFSASHILKGLPDGHQCGRLHGHNYRVEVVLRGDTLSEVGFVRDYGELALFKRFLDDTCDHRHLNDVFPFNPTAENLAKCWFDWCVERWPEVVAVRVSETPKTWAEYRK